MNIGTAIRIHTTCCVAVIILAAQQTNGQVATYQPLKSWSDPRVESYRQWDSIRQAVESRATRAMRSDARPQLPGYRTTNVELLQDALLRKHPKLLRNSPAKARQLLLRRYVNNLPQLRGIMAEAIFVERNPEWGYVSKANAPQHDVYRWQPGSKIPFTGQVKFHIDGRASVYAADMRKDWRSTRFFVPDDHVSHLREHLKQKAKTLDAAGKQTEARRAWRDYGRVKGIGATSTVIHDATAVAAKKVSRELYGSYTSLGAALSLSFGQTMWDWSQGELFANEALYRLGKSGSLIGAGLGTDFLLMRIKDGAWRGTIRGNVVVGTAITVVEVTWLLHEHGWRQAFHRADFYESVAGSVGALTLFVSAGALTTAATAETGPFAPVIGTAAGLIAGGAGYFGGQTAMHFALELLDPQFLHEQERQRFQAVRDGLTKRIADTSSWPPVAKPTTGLSP